MMTLVLGGEKSGKSDYALSLLAAAPRPHAFVATGRALDPAFAAQIALHKKNRPAGLALAETILELPETLVDLRPRYAAILADSLDFWLFSCLRAGVLGERAAALESVLAAWEGPELILAGAEAGLGPMASDAFTREFARALGALNQMAARRAGRAVLVVAGLPLTLKEPVRERAQ
ncbi:MAG: bifunctional adenosylcobinamide kinase/adenosylcobinamide-phosphate guanylyltransferase [Desulfovibrionaceae bacterium]|nr:bifunctional adenosylcobinamide kinase/adenosylcobinamide-phosphate guanylyltransferase [Desulfovibrionaceae bacterium]MBF0515130.1 bifunctional adenosylcobinamide kinase/adenosylcobinamide-phosphate guanylyltransferase [Desulfovibrionaceae bacterium]